LIIYTVPQEQPGLEKSVGAASVNEFTLFLVCQILAQLQVQVP